MYFNTFHNQAWFSFPTRSFKDTVFTFSQFHFWKLSKNPTISQPTQRIWLYFQDGVKGMLSLPCKSEQHEPLMGVYELITSIFKIIFTLMTQMFLFFFF